MELDSKSKIINKFVRKCPDTNEYKERLENELNLIEKKILLTIYFKYVKY